MSSSRFESLLDDWRGLGASASQALAHRRLPSLLKSVGLSQWNPDSSPRPSTGLLLGVAPWSRHDLRLLDEVSRLPVRDRADLVVLDVQDTPSPSALLAAIPELEAPPAHTPLLVELGNAAGPNISSGADARARLSELIPGLRVGLTEPGPRSQVPDPMTAAESISTNDLVRVEILLASHRPLGASVASRQSQLTPPGGRTLGRLAVVKE